MPRIARLPALLALLVLLAPGLVLAEEKTFEDKNFKLEASESWQWLEVASDMAEIGYVASLGRRAAGSVAMVSVRVAPTNGLTLAEQSKEVKDGLSANLQAVQGSKIMKGMLSGLECDLILIKGIDKRDSHVLLKAYNLEAGGMFHQLIFTLIDGAETKQAREVDALRRGYRLLKGAGPMEEEPEDLGGVGLGGGDEDGSAPAEQGRTVVFDKQNIKWTLPEGSPFEWVSVNRDQGVDEGMLIRAAARKEIPAADDAEKKQEFNECIVSLYVGPQGQGWTPKALVNNRGFQSSIEESAFDRVDYGRMKVIDELAIGNMKGAAIQMVGSKEVVVGDETENKVRVFRAYAVGLKGRRYVWEVLLTGDGMVDDVFKDPLKALMDGVEFIDTFVWVRGPLAIPGIPSHSQERGHHIDEEREITSLGFEAEKPKGMAQLTFESQYTGGSLRVAWEKRNDDKTAYLYFDVQSWPKKTTREIRDFDVGKVKEREGQWLEHASSPQTIAKGREPWFKSKFGRARGLGYEFTGFLGETPFTEEGFVVEYKDYVYWIRIQLGGKDAERTFSKDVKALKKALKFSS